MGKHPRLPNEALVVRCGKPPFDPYVLRHRGCAEHEGLFGFSVQSAANVELEVLAARCENNRVGVLTVGVIRELGYDVVATSGRGHHATVSVPRNWDLERARILGALFEDRPNPVPKAERKR